MIEKIIGKVKGIFNTITMMDIIISIVYILLGIVFLLTTNLTGLALAIFIAILLLMNSAISIYSYLKNEDILLFNNNLIYGIILTIVALFAPFLSQYLAIIMGIYLIVVGIQKVNVSLSLKLLAESSWFLTLVIGIVLILIAIATIFTNIDNIVKVTSIYLIGYGIINFTYAVLLRKRSQYIL